MSSVIVKGMKMPENCFECPCCRHDSRNGYQKEQCNLTLDVFDAGYYERFEGRAQNCPLVALPDKHGRLIDADELETDAEYYDGDFLAYSVSQVDNTPTIFEPED